ncbi:MAG: hypothetical protein QOE72_3222 [Chloroflexota bacterium]|jgi:hypothetical protein|nr:hypothetical protein [Chloroflexota bacterium]
MRRSHIVGAAFLAVAITPWAAPPSPVGAATPARKEIQGGWIGALPCVTTAATPEPGRPTTLRPATCVSGTFWDGVWTGHTHFVATGTQDLVSGDMSMTIDEIFYGVATEDHSRGTLHLLGTITIDGATSTVRVHEVVVGGTGQFAGAVGDVVFEGTQLSAVSGHGGYHGWWSRPSTPQT